MDGKSKSVIKFHARDHPMDPDFRSARMCQAEDPGWRISRQLLEAVALHLETREYDDVAYHMGALRTIPVSEVSAMNFIGWRSYVSSSDAGEQKYRVAERDTDGTKRRKWRDRSWVTVSCLTIAVSSRRSCRSDNTPSVTQYTQDVDANGHRRNRDADFVPMQQWGQIHQFLEFQYDEAACLVAVIQPYKVKSWVRNITEPPLRIVKKDGNRFQVVGVEYLDAVLGRVRREVKGNGKYVVDIVFDSSMGRLRG
jgi:hypothetical protein